MNGRCCESGEGQTKSRRSISPDIDRGWAFVVVFAGFSSLFLTQGVAYSSSVFYVIFLDEFEESPSFTAWAVTTIFCCTTAFGPVVSALTQWINRRTLMAIGTIMSTCGLIASSFANSLEVILVTFGIVTGTGWCAPTLFTYVKVTEYFNEYRTMMITLTSTGIAIGQFVYPPMLQYLFDMYHWRGAFIIIAGLNLNLLVIAAVMMPPRKPPVSELEFAEMEALVDSSKQVNLDQENEHTTSTISCLKRQMAPLKNFRFVLYLGSVFFYYVGVQSVQTHIGNYSRVTGSTITQSTMLVSFIGFGGLISRLTIAPGIHYTKVNVVLVFLASMIFAGLVCFLFVLYDVFPYLTVICFVFGYQSGASSLLSESLIAINGHDNFDQALGQCFFVCSIGVLLGGPIAGWLFELDPSYVVTFVASGIILIGAGLLLVPGYIRSRKSLKKPASIMHTSMT